ncbi:MAG: NAD-binding protein [Candidatus Lokiarchaeota archaeon]|nr:NAD-binding protein [Candidatus Lokiarchaeota archaeon]
MKTLVYGAGVLGSLYAAVLKLSGKDVTLLARGKRLEELRDHGLVIENLITEKTIQTKIDLIDSKLTENNNFDLILVIISTSIP